MTPIPWESHCFRGCSRIFQLENIRYLDEILRVDYESVLVCIYCLSFTLCLYCLKQNKPKCLEYSTENNCTKCEPGFYVNSNSCWEQYQEGCIEFKGDNTIDCQKCREGYWRSDGSGSRTAETRTLISSLTPTPRYLGFFILNFVYKLSLIFQV